MKQAGSDRHDHNYQNFLPNGRKVALPVKIEDLKHFCIYKTATGPKWSSWTRAWFTPEGYLRVCFLDISGGPAGLKPDYGYECCRPDVLARDGIKRCYRWCESRDGGATWKMIREVDASDPLKPQPNAFLPLENGSVLGIGGVLAEWDFKKSTYVTICHAMAWLSTDGGQTWGKPVSLNDPNKMGAAWCHPRRLRDGTIVLPCYGEFDKDTPVAPSTDAWLWFSKDGGKRWSEPLLLVRGAPTRTSDEPDVVELANGDLLVTLRHANPKAKGAAVYLNCGQIIVKKTTSGWKPGPLRQTRMGFRGFPILLRTRNGILISAGSGNQFNFSIDEGRTWSATASLADPAYNRHNHYPYLLEMPDGRILSVYHVGNHWTYPPPKEQWIHATSFRLKR